MKTMYRLVFVILILISFNSCQDKQPNEVEKESILQPDEQQFADEVENTQMAIDELEGELDKIDEALEDVMLEMEKEMEYEEETEVDSLP